MQWLKGFFSEDSGGASAMRLIFIIGSIWLMAFTTLSVFHYKVNFVDACQYFVIIFGLFNGGKYLQKRIETKPAQ